MGKRFTEISEKFKNFIEAQKLFFVGTATADGRVNLSPKGMDTFKVMDPNNVLWLNLTGSGNETATHLLENNRMTVMFTAFEGPPMIMRLYGEAQVYHPRDSEWDDHIQSFPITAGARQIFHLKVDLVQTSCGMAVPYYDYKGEREQLKDWAEKIGPDGIKKYWKEKNQVSIDGKETKIFL